MDAHLMSYDAEQIQSIWIARLSLENSPVDLFRLRQAPRLMVFHAQLYRLADRSDRLLGSHSFGFGRRTIRRSLSMSLWSRPEADIRVLPLSGIAGSAPMQTAQRDRRFIAAS